MARPAASLTGNGEENTRAKPSIAAAVAATSLGPHQRRCTPELIAQAHAAGLMVSTWTVNDQARALALAGMGVDAIITDVPTQALTWL